MEQISEEEMLRFVMEEGTPVNYPLHPLLHSVSTKILSGSACGSSSEQVHSPSPATPHTTEFKIQAKKGFHHQSWSGGMPSKIQSRTARLFDSDDDCPAGGAGKVRKLHLGELIPPQIPSSCDSSPFTEPYKTDSSFKLTSKAGLESSVREVFEPQEQAGAVSDQHSHKKTDLHSQKKTDRDFPWPTSSAQLQALGRMSFRKAFMVLAKFPNGQWINVFEAKDLTFLNSLSLEKLELELQKRAAAYFKEDLPYRNKTNWENVDVNQHLAYKATITRKGECIFQGPCVERGKTPLQRAFGDDNVLEVHFEDLNNNFQAEGMYKKLGREGILVGLRRYEFFTYKDPKAKKKHGLLKDNPSSVKSFFVCTESRAEADHYDPKFREFESIEEARHFMMHISTETQLSKYIARLQLTLSQTLRLDLDFTNINVYEIPDIVCTDDDGKIVYDENSKPLIHTDGTGYISADLARLCPCSIFKGRKQAHIEEQQEYPLLMQIRLFHCGNVYKGTLLVNNQLEKNTICYRPSMRKVKMDVKRLSSSFNSLEVCNTSRRPGDAKLFQHLVLLLRIGGVPESLILKFLDKSLEEIMTSFRDRSAATKVISQCAEFVEVYLMAFRMLSIVPMEDAYLQKLLWDLSKSKLQELKKARIPVRDTFNLMGCADPTGKLGPNQVVIILGDGPIYASKVLVYKPPGLHPGDIHVFEATCCQGFEEIVGSGKYAIFFSVKGPRAVVDEMANSDLDGDLYWVCKNREIIKYFTPGKVWQKPVKPVSCPLKTPTSLKDLQEEHFQSFWKSRFNPSAVMGQAANNWLAHMDRFLVACNLEPAEGAYHWETALKLVDVYYDALDAEKSGERVIVKSNLKAKHWPHYMEKDEGKYFQEYSVYKSSSTLGKIYDTVKNRLPEDDACLLSPNGVIELDPAIEYPGYKRHLISWGDHFREYRLHVQDIMKKFTDEDLRSAAIDKMLQKYRQILYHANSMMESQRTKEELYQEASAIYAIVYTEAKHKYATHKDRKNLNYDRPRHGLSNDLYPKPGLQFAWKVAGFALCRLYAEIKGVEPIVSSMDPWLEITVKKPKLKH